MKMQEYPPSRIESPISNFDQVVDKVSKILLDVHLQKYHITNGTLDNFYNDILEQVITDVTLIPVHRDVAIEDIDPDEDRLQMHDAILAIVQIVAYAFGKNQRDVEKDFCARIKQYPVDDVRQAAILKETNRLH